MVGVIAVLVLLSADVAFVALLLGLPLSVISVLWVALALVSLPLLGLVGYRTWALLRSDYFLSQNALTITWGDIIEVVPMADIERLVPASEVEDDLLPDGLWWPGNFVGRTDVARFGPVAFFAGAPQAEALVVQVAGGAYVISPGDIDAFIAHYETAQTEGITEPVEYVTLRGPLHSVAIMQNRLGLLLVLLPLAFALLLFGFIGLQVGALPAEVPLRFNADRLPDPNSLAPAGRLVILPLIGGIVWLVNGLFGVALHANENERSLAYLLWVGGLAVQMLLWGAAVALIAVA